jgi:hypothetical protein
MSEDFLSRWSRRKREARRAGEAEPDPTRNPPGLADGVQATAAESPPPPQSEAAEITAEEIAQLPRPEDLTAESDLAAFLRKGVPEALRNAALRRMWSLDPAIRDYVGHARDYAYDWNTPGGVPGFGPLSSAEVDEAIRGLVGSPQQPGETERSGTALADRAASQHREAATDEASEASQPVSEPRAASQQEAEVEDEPLSSTDVALHGKNLPTGRAAVESSVDAPQPELRLDDRAAAIARRHGGAKPL